MFLITVRKYRRDGKRYRTRYYREFVNGRPRYVAKKEASWFNEPEVVLAQLRQLFPNDVFTCIKAGERPSREKLPPPPPAPTQEDAFA